jgi:hypothetical protein
MISGAGASAPERGWGSPMASRARLIGMLLLLSCGGSAHDLSIDEAPEALLRGQVNHEELIRMYPGSPLLAALIWTEEPPRDPVCEHYGAALYGACPDRNLVRYVDDSKPAAIAPVEPDGRFQLPLFKWPDQHALTYGSLVVLEDTSGDGQAMYKGHPYPFQGPAEFAPDRIVAASFSSQAKVQLRVVYRPPGASTDAIAPGCPVPERISYLETYPSMRNCRTISTLQRRSVSALSPEESDALACRMVQNPTKILPAPVEAPAPGSGDRTVCLPGGRMAIVGPPPCFPFRFYALKGCGNDLFCPKPEWDFNPPSWWPCP